ncbi:MAG: hypothetical protein ACRERD_18945, partial [Candidatus Binatia bacterium]
MRELLVAIVATGLVGVLLWPFIRRRGVRLWEKTKKKPDDEVDNLEKTFERKVEVVVPAEEELQSEQANPPSAPQTENGWPYEGNVLNTPDDTVGRLEPDVLQCYTPDEVSPDYGTGEPSGPIADGEKSYGEVPQTRESEFTDEKPAESLLIGAANEPTSVDNEQEENLTRPLPFSLPEPIVMPQEISPQTKV